MYYWRPPKKKYNYYFCLDYENKLIIYPTKKEKSKEVYGVTSKNKKTALRDFIRYCYSEYKKDYSVGRKDLIIEAIETTKEKYEKQFPEMFL